MTAVEIIGAAFGVLGTLLLAFNGRRAGWGFIAYLASNAAWIVFAVQHSHLGLLVQQIAFTAASVIGVCKWFKPQQWFCQHRFDLADLSKRDAEGLVHCPCYKCGKELSAEYGLGLPGCFDRNTTS